VAIVSRSSLGREFHSLGPIAENARSPHEFRERHPGCRLRRCRCELVTLLLLQPTFPSSVLMRRRRHLHKLIGVLTNPAARLTGQLQLDALILRFLCDILFDLKKEQRFVELLL